MSAIGVDPITLLRWCVMQIVHIQVNSPNVEIRFGQQNLLPSPRGANYSDMKRDTIDENHCSLQQSLFEVYKYYSVLRP